MSPLPFIKCDDSCKAVALFCVFTFSDEQQPYFHRVVLCGEFVMEVFNSESCRPERETGVIFALPEAPEPSFREKSAQRGRLQTDRVLTQLLHPHGSALHFSLSADVHATWSVRNQGWGNQRFEKVYFFCFFPPWLCYANSSKPVHQVVSCCILCIREQTVQSASWFSVNLAWIEQNNSCVIPKWIICEHNLWI